MKVRLILLVAAMVLGLKAAPVKAQRPADFPLPSQTRRYHLEGTVIALRPNARQLVVDAQAIPGFMAAMVTPFPVRDTAVFSQLGPGDQISADVVVIAGASWLENVAQQVAAAPSATAGPMVDSTEVGRRDSARPPKDSIGIKPPSVDSVLRPNVLGDIKPPPVDSVLRPNTLRDSTALRYPIR